MCHYVTGILVPLHNLIVFTTSGVAADLIKAMEFVIVTYCLVLSCAKLQLSQPVVGYRRATLSLYYHREHIWDFSHLPDHIKEPPQFSP